MGESGNMEGRTSQERRDGVIETFRKAYKAVSKALPGSKRGLTKVPTNKNVTASSLIKKCAFSSLADVAKQRHR